MTASPIPDPVEAAVRAQSIFDTVNLRNNPDVSEVYVRIRIEALDEDLRELAGALGYRIEKAAPTTKQGSKEDA